MAGTTLNRQLTVPRGGRISFALATRADDAGIRRLLRENPMSGQVALTLEREPNYFSDANLPGTEKQTIIAQENGRLVCAGSCAMRLRFVNGQPRRVGYLGGLRLDARVGGHFDVLRRGYEFFRELQADAPADFYFTSIANDNLPARKFLERGLPGMPAYEFAGEFVTMLLPVGAHASGCSADKLKLELQRTADAPQVAEFLLLHAAQSQFSPCWTADELCALADLGLRTEDFLTVPKADGLAACAALWDQRSFKQTVIHGYEPWLARTRPVINFAARMLGTARLPAIGTPVAHAYVSHLAMAAENLNLFNPLIENLLTLATERKIEFLTLGFSADDPRLKMLRTKFRGREYRSRIYVVRWPELGGSVRELDGRCLGPEVALL